MGSQAFYRRAQVQTLASVGVLKHCNNESDDFLKYIFDGDERWFHCCSP
jgi:hypothetical protein